MYQSTLKKRANMNEQDLPKDLIKRYLAGNCTAEEKALVESWHLSEFRQSQTSPSAATISRTHPQMRQIILAHVGQARVRPL
jgi:transmembrane sensor